MAANWPGHQLARPLNQLLQPTLRPCPPTSRSLKKQKKLEANHPTKNPASQKPNVPQPIDPKEAAGKLSNFAIGPDGQK